MIRDYVLLITGCINPDNETPFLKIRDSSTRRKQYMESIRFYIEESHAKKIVFCDNSNQKADNNLEQIVKKNNKEFEWLSFCGNIEKAVEKGKGYGEGEIIDYALNHSRLLEESDYFVKVTGRILVKNINILLAAMNKRRTYFQCNSDNNVDTRLYGMPKHSYRDYFRDVYKTVDDTNGYYLEHAFAKVIHDYSVNIQHFVVCPNISGISGSTGEHYDLSLKQRVKITLKNYKDSILPKK